MLLRILVKYRNPEPFINIPSISLIENRVTVYMLHIS